MAKAPAVQKPHSNGLWSLERSHIYDDYGRDNLFEFALAPGRYRVTVGAGRPGRAYPGDPHTVIVEGTRLIDDEPTSDASRVFRRSGQRYNQINADALLARASFN